MIASYLRNWSWRQVIWGPNGQLDYADYIRLTKPYPFDLFRLITGKNATDIILLSSILGLTYTPSYAAIGGSFPQGATVFMGQVAGAAEGGPPGSAGNAIQLFVTSAEGVENFTVETLESIADFIGTHPGELARTRMASMRKAP